MSRNGAVLPLPHFSFNQRQIAAAFYRQRDVRTGTHIWLARYADPRRCTGMIPIAKASEGVRVGCVLFSLFT